MAVAGPHTGAGGAHRCQGSLSVHVGQGSAIPGPLKAGHFCIRSEFPITPLHKHKSTPGHIFRICHAEVFTCELTVHCFIWIRYR